MAFNWKSEYHRYQRYFVNLETLYRKREVIVYTGITLSLFAISFFTFFALKPTANVILSLVSEIKEKKAIVEQLQSKINALAVAQNNYSSQGSLINLVDEALPDNPSLSEIVWYFESLFKEQELTIRDINYDQIVYSQPSPPSTPSQNQEPKIIGFNLTVLGNYENLKTALNRIKNLRRIVIIDTFSLSLAGIEGAETLNLNIVGRAFYYPMIKIP